jgi:hypothetical protein
MVTLDQRELNYPINLRKKVVNWFKNQIHTMSSAQRECTKNIKYSAGSEEEENISSDGESSS